MELYHFTCEHRAVMIVKDGWLRPNPHTGLLWLTDEAMPSRAGLGLTSETLTCDRTAVRFEVAEADDIHRWGKVRMQFSSRVRDALELGAGRTPQHWFITAVPHRFLAMIAAPR